MTDPFQMMGTDFQKLVWEQLLAIPLGETRSYKQMLAVPILFPSQYLVTEQLGPMENSEDIVVKEGLRQRRNCLEKKVPSRSAMGQHHPINPSTILIFVNLDYQ